MGIKRPSYRLGWKTPGGEKWGWDVAIFDPDVPAECGEILIMTPASPPSIGWSSPEEARTAAVAALRDLADRIERGEP